MRWRSILDAGFVYSKGAFDYYIKGNLIFQPNQAAGGQCGLYFFVK